LKATGVIAELENRRMCIEDEESVWHIKAEKLHNHCTLDKVTGEKNQRKKKTIHLNVIIIFL